MNTALPLSPSQLTPLHPPMLSPLLRPHLLSEQTDHTVAENTAVEKIMEGNTVEGSIVVMIIAESIVVNTTVMDMDTAMDVIAITGMDSGMTGAATIRDAVLIERHGDEVEVL